MADRASAARVTVVVPCFNQAHFLKVSLGSLREQTFDSWEAIVVDDGSADGEHARATIDGLDDARIRYARRDANGGRAAARNTGLGGTTSELVLFLDADDRLTPDCLATLVEVLDGDAELDGAYGDVRNFGRAEDVRVHLGPPAEANGRPVLHEAHVVPTNGTLLRRALLERIGGFDEAEALRPAREDLEFWIRAFGEGARVRRVARPLYERRVVHASSYGSPDDDRVAEHVHAKHRAAFERAGEGGAFLARWYVRAASAAYARGERKRAFDLTLRARRADPARVGLKAAVRRLLPFSLNRAIDGGAIRRAIPFVGYPLCGAERFRPFFVIGMGRSGNTLLRRILTSHSRLHLPPETFVIGSCIRKFRQRSSKLSWPDLVSMVMAEFEFHPEFHLFEMELAPVVERLSYAPAERRNLATLIDAVFRHHAETHGIPFERWGDKTPMNSLDDALARGDEPRQLGAGTPETLERLLRVFPDAQFLHIYRDGCDVVHSTLRGGFFDDIEAAARRWLHVERQTRRFAREHADRSHDVRYEDLVTKPDAVVRGICAFLGVEFEDAMLTSEAGSSQLGDVPAWFWHENVGKPISADNAGKARRLFTRAEKERLQRVLGDALAEFGYPPATD